MKLRKGIILAGGAGTRLNPLTIALSKQLLPVYDKPMIYYPLSILMLAGIRDILIITTPQDQALFKKLLGTGIQWGINLAYQIQPEPKGIAQALVIAEEFLDGSPSTLILGDNIFYGDGIGQLLGSNAGSASGATIFAYSVTDPQRYGVVEFDAGGRPTALVEKPVAPRSNWAVTGLYFYDSRASELARTLKPAPRGELEITDLNRLYLESGDLHVERLGRGYAWFDAGTHDSLLDAGNFIRTVESRQGLKIACPEEIAFRKKYIGLDDLKSLLISHGKTLYSEYLKFLIQEAEQRRLLQEARELVV